MIEFYSQALAIISKWPGMGPLASQRMLEYFMQDVQTKKKLQDLESLINKFQQCPSCFLYTIKESSNCLNCELPLDNLIIVASFLDYFACQQHYFFKRLRFFCLNGYVSPQKEKTLLNTHTLSLLSLLKENTSTRVFFLFNQSLESRATYWLIEKNLGNTELLKNCSCLLKDKEFLYALAIDEKEEYVQSLQSLVNAS